MKNDIIIFAFGVFFTIAAACHLAASYTALLTTIG